MRVDRAERGIGETERERESREMRSLGEQAKWKRDPLGSETERGERDR